jgi:hypothetical protein
MSWVFFSANHVRQSHFSLIWRHDPLVLSDQSHSRAAKMCKLSLRPNDPTTDRLMTAADLGHIYTKRSMEDDSSRNDSDLYSGYVRFESRLGDRLFLSRFFVIFLSHSRRIESIVFWSITACSPLKVNWRFGGACDLHLQGRRIRQARNQCEAHNKQE